MEDKFLRNTIGRRKMESNDMFLYRIEKWQLIYHNLVAVNVELFLYFTESCDLLDQVVLDGKAYSR